jgi:AcrR family transcriptional regulator
MRAQTEACPSRPAPTERERQRRAYILEAARAIFIAHGRTRVTLKDVAIATGLTQISIRNQIADLDHLFALTLHKYLDEILIAISAVPRHHADLLARRRAEYFRITRGICNVPTPLHFLWMRDRFTLPDDQLEPLEQARRTLGFLLAGEDWETALLLLDSHHLDTPQIEAMLAALAPSVQPEAQIEKEQPQATPSPRREIRLVPKLKTGPAIAPLAWLAAQPPPGRVS